MKDYIQIGIEKWIREKTILYFGGSAGQQRVPSSYFNNFDLLFASKEMQLEIVRHFYELYQKAKTLNEEGERVLEEAKQEVDDTEQGIEENVTNCKTIK